MVEVNVISKTDYKLIFQALLCPFLLLSQARFLKRTVSFFAMEHFSLAISDGKVTSNHALLPLLKCTKVQGADGESGDFCQRV